MECLRTCRTLFICRDVLCTQIGGHFLFFVLYSYNSKKQKASTFKTWNKNAASSSPLAQFQERRNEASSGAHAQVPHTFFSRDLSSTFKGGNISIPKSQREQSPSALGAYNGEPSFSADMDAFIERAVSAIVQVHCASS